MKRISSILLIALAVLFVIPTMNSCKKGEEDPFFSFLTRKQRVSGDWAIKSNIRNIINLDVDAQTIVEDFVIDGDGITITTDSINFQKDTTIIVKGDVLEDKIIFENDGTYSYKLKYNTLEIDDKMDEATQTQTVTTVKLTKELIQTGTWNFISGVEKDWKSKERIVISIENSSVSETIITKIERTQNGVVMDPTTENVNNVIKSSYENGENTMVWGIVMLKSKEMKLYRKISNDVVEFSVQTDKNEGSETLILSQE